jgi:PEP-CTERM motif
MKSVFLIAGLLAGACFLCLSVPATATAGSTPTISWAGHPGASPKWWIRLADSYEFGGTDSAPALDQRGNEDKTWEFRISAASFDTPSSSYQVPEPATTMLLGLGLIGLAGLGRRKFKK